MSRSAVEYLARRTIVETLPRLRRLRRPISFHQPFFQFLVARSTKTTHTFLIIFKLETKYERRGVHQLLPGRGIIEGHTGIQVTHSRIVGEHVQTHLVPGALATLRKNGSTSEENDSLLVPEWLRPCSWCCKRIESRTHRPTKKARLRHEGPLLLSLLTGYNLISLGSRFWN